MLVPLAFSLYYAEPDTLAFAISLAITVGSGVFLFFTTRSRKDAILTRREALAMVTFSWLVVSVFGALPYQLSHTFPNYLDAFFESLSGFTTTGASVLTSIETEPHGILMWRDLTQWLGGMGIIVLFVAMFPLVGMGTAYLFEAESPGPEISRMTAHIRDTSRTIWMLYVGFTALEALLLLTVGQLGFFDSLSHAFGTMATGGFSPKNASVGTFDSLSVNIIITCFMFLAGINFALYYILLWKRSFASFFRDTEFRLYFFIMVGAFVLIACDLIINTDYAVRTALEESAFTSASIQTTTGFAVSDFDTWPEFSRILLLCLMVVGGSAGSTGGAVKVIRIAVLAKYAIRQVQLVINPKAIISLRMGERVLSENVISRIVGFTIIYLGIIGAGILAMSFLGYDITTSVSSVISSVGNVGPGLGSVGPAGHYADICTSGKVVLMTCMLVGRLEILTVLAILTREFWRWR